MQERMGVVSRTIISAIPDLIHFSFLFGVVYMGFVIGHSVYLLLLVQKYKC
jgi:hypothetical protein